MIPFVKSLFEITKMILKCTYVCVSVCEHIAQKAAQIYMALNLTWLKFNQEFDTLIIKKL